MKINKDMCESWSVVNCADCNVIRNSKDCKKYKTNHPKWHQSAKWCGIKKD